jgi:mediator of RNA polymerase II transcription subunit 16, fungi type
MFVAMATTSKQLRIVQVGINWNIPKQENPQGMPPGGYQLSPTLHERHVAATSWLQPETGDSYFDSAMSKLSHIELLPAMLDQATRKWSNPVVLTVRTYLPIVNSPYNQEIQSVVDRWELFMDQQQTLHSAFEQLANKRSGAGLAPPVCTPVGVFDHPLTKS